MEPWKPQSGGLVVTMPMRAWNNEVEAKTRGPEVCSMKGLWQRKRQQINIEIEIRLIGLEPYWYRLHACPSLARSVTRDYLHTHIWNNNFLTLTTLEVLQEVWYSRNHTTLQQALVTDLDTNTDRELHHLAGKVKQRKSIKQNAPRMSTKVTPNPPVRKQHIIPAPTPVTQATNEDREWTLCGRATRE